MAEPLPNDKTSYFVLDVTAFTEGLANIKRWVESDKYDTRLFVPQYTIHELDFLKKGHNMIARNARESIRFIELKISGDNYNIQNNKLMLESPKDTGPSWKKCLKFKTRNPNITDFPDHHSAHKSINGLINQNTVLKKDGEIMYEQDLLSQNGEDDLQEPQKNQLISKAEIPNRYKSLLRRLIQKVHVEDLNWKLVTDDPILKIWCGSFNITCVNVIDADCQMFSKSLPSNNSCNDPITIALSNVSIKESCNISPKATSQGQEPENNNTKSKRRRGRRRSNKQPIKETSHTDGNSNPEQQTVYSKNTDGSFIRIEKYNNISYAPRGNGELWTP